MIMAICALLVGCSQSFAKPPHVLSMSSTHASNPQETKLFQRVHYKFLCMVCYAIPSIFLFSSIFQLKSILLCENLVIKALTKLMAHFTFLEPKIEENRQLALWHLVNRLG